MLALPVTTSSVVPHSLGLILLACAVAAGGDSDSSGPLGEGSAAREHALMRRLAAGDARALEELYDRHGRLVFSLACRIAEQPADAEDVTQDVFTQAWRRAAQYDPRRGSVAAWLLVMTRSRALDRLRRQRSRPDGRDTVDEEHLSRMSGDAPDSEQRLMTRVEVERLRTALRDLPSAEREAIELAYYSGLTQAEIAVRLDQPLGTVKTRVRSGLIRLRTSMAGVRS
jgi:RNA polymerase sigma-70 factor, ECF subfamily